MGWKGGRGLALAFSFLFTFSRYSLTTSLNAQKGKSSLPLLVQSQQLGPPLKSCSSRMVSTLPSILTWRETGHASGDGRIDEVLLGVVFVACRSWVYEGQDGMDTLQGFNQVVYVVVIHKTPSHSRCGNFRGRRLGRVSV